ncbi:MAG: 1,4-dihydroxy-2-naphthoate polyprenyltransferase [Chloroflexi bacterium]|nr:1,4-dihydroxy-2-naphthoate polyprenyltransferase [Chloroflexota bacterium]
MRRWILAARIRTLPAAVVPVVLGAVAARPINYPMTTLAAAVALSLQIATNFANDYSDGVKGSDAERVGPFRLTASGLVAASAVKKMAFVWFGVAAVLGLAIASTTSWWLILIGASAIAAGWLYTGGPHPYGYLGLGELFVMIYFGFVATVGTSYIQHRSIPATAWWLGLAAGSMACTLLEANNLRDADQDRVVGKRTLAARLGRERGSWLYVACVVGVGVGAGMAIPRGTVLAALYLIPLRAFVFTERRGRDLLPLLQQSALLQLVIGALLSALLFVA